MLTPRALPPMQAMPLGGGRMPARETGRGVFSRRTPVVEAVERASPSVVNLGTERIVQTIYNVPMLSRRAALYDKYLVEEVVIIPMPMPPKTQRTHALGSGVIVDERGYILTNNHVIDRASRMRVMLDNNDTYDASLVAADEMDDLALIKIDVGTNRTLKAMDLVDTDEVLLGETVIAMGNPFGLSHTVTVGVLSATNRPATYRGELLYKDILQTDAAVNPGSSGGPLLDIEGKLIGVNVAIYQEGQNIGFAQPVHRVRELLGRWLSPQLLKKQWLGFAAEWDSGAVRVSFVPTNSPVQNSGMRVGAVINGVNGRATPDLFSFNRQLLGYNEGESVDVTWTFDGETRTSKLRVLSSAQQDGNELAWRRLGLKLKPAADAIMPLRYEKSLPIDDVEKDGPGASEGLQAGRYIWKINDIEIRNLDDVAVALENVHKGDKIVVGLADYSQDATNVVIRQSHVQVTAN